jgi:predicted nucleotidyltransferase component of viral defense system
MLHSKGIITSLQKNILLNFSELPDAKHFYLTGGTALADFYLGHRRSFDLDLFTVEQKILLPFSRVFEKEFAKSFSVSTVRRFETFSEFEIETGDEQVKVQLAYDSPFRFNEPIDSALKVRVNDYEDLIIDKLLAFFGRTEPRDAVDLFFILKEEKIDKLIPLAKKKDPGFDSYWLAIALKKTEEFPDNIEEWPVEMLQKIEIPQLKNLFGSLARDIMDSLSKF